jgi:hypothetical protein
MAEEDSRYANSPALFLKLDRFDRVYYERSAGFAYSSQLDYQVPQAATLFEIPNLEVNIRILAGERPTKS